jgi:predicted DNA-binding transcriptional regulator AlpA
MKRAGENLSELMALNVSQATARIGVSRPTMYEHMSVQNFQSTPHCF